MSGIDSQNSLNVSLGQILSLTGIIGGRFSLKEKFWKAWHIAKFFGFPVKKSYKDYLWHSVLIDPEGPQGVSPDFWYNLKDEKIWLLGIGDKTFSQTEFAGENSGLR